MRQKWDPHIRSKRSKFNSLCTAHSYVTRDAECQRTYLAVVIPNIYKDHAGRRTFQPCYQAVKRQLSTNDYAVQLPRCTLPPHASTLASWKHTAKAGQRERSTPGFSGVSLPPGFSGVLLRRIFPGNLLHWSSTDNAQLCPPGVSFLIKQIDNIS